MPKPRIFLSSTCYDLTQVRSELTSFLEERGFDVINSEKSSFGVTPGRHSHSACLEEVDNANYLLLLIGKRYGGNYIGSEKSITNEEYNRAVRNKIPCIVCVDEKVNQNRQLYKNNPQGDFSSIVDNTKIFDFIDYIASGHSDNWLHSFNNIQDIRNILTNQFAHYLFNYSMSLSKNNEKINDGSVIFVEFPQNLEKIKDEHFVTCDVSKRSAFLRQILKTFHLSLSLFIPSSLFPPLADFFTNSFFRLHLASWVI